MAYKNVDCLNHRHMNAEVVVLGTSGSLCGVDMSQFADKIVIGTNDALMVAKAEHCFVVHYLMLVDFGAAQRALPYLLEHTGVTVVCTNRIAEVLHDGGFRDPMYVFEYKPLKSIRQKGPFCQANNTAHYAVELAFRLRGPYYGSITLWGVDLRWPTDEEREAGETDHYWGDAYKDGCREGFKTTLAWFEKTRDVLKRHQVRLLMMSRWSSPLRDLLQG